MQIKMEYKWCVAIDNIAIYISACEWQASSSK